MNQMSPIEPQFGKQRPLWDYRTRACVYGLATDEMNRIMVVSTRGKLILPGGGVDGDESVEDALRRETLEETGWQVAVEDEICRARQYIVSRRKNKAFNKHAQFFRIALLRSDGPPLEDDHAPLWMDIGEASRKLNHSFHRWAVEQLRR